jgi:tetratricopeptide (TPR) repeat protein
MIAIFSMISFSLHAVSSIISKEGKVYNLIVKGGGEARPIVWGIANESIKERPILGYGNENFEYAYQNHLDVRIIGLENPDWFDKVHNVTLDQLIATGYIGTGLMFVIFCLICFYSFRLYFQEKKFIFLVIPFIFLFHFLQAQTFFLTDSSLFLLFLLLAFLMSHEKDISINILWGKYGNWCYAVFTAIIITAFVYFVSIPIKQNTLLPHIANADRRIDRMALYPSLAKLKHIPVETLRSLSTNFTIETAHRAKELQEKGLIEEVGEEYQFYLDAYKEYYKMYDNSYRYLIEYARMINTSFIFKIDDLKKGEELARRALGVSTSYPHAYWILAENLYYQGRLEEALDSARHAYDIDPTIKQSMFLYEFMQNQVKSKDTLRSFIYISDI